MGGPSSSLVYGQLHAWMQGAGYDDACVCRMDSVLSMFAAVRSGMGVAVLPCYLADACPELTRPGDTVDDLAVDLWLLTHPDLRHAARVRTFLAGCCKNRNGLVVDAELTLATGLAEREATLAMLDVEAQRAGASRLRPTRPMMSKPLSATCASARSRRISPSTAAFPRPARSARQPSTSAPRTIPATASAYAAESASRRCSDGSRRRPVSPRSKSKADRKSPPSSDSQSPPITSSDCTNYWPKPPHKTLPPTPKPTLTIVPTPEIQSKQNTHPEIFEKQPNQPFCSSLLDHFGKLGALL